MTRSNSVYFYRLDAEYIKYIHLDFTALLLLHPQEVKVSSTTTITTTPAAAVCGSVEHTLQERIIMYNTAISNAKAAGESAKARRYDRGLKVSTIPMNKLQIFSCALRDSVNLHFLYYI